MEKDKFIFIDRNNRDKLRNIVLLFSNETLAAEDFMDKLEQALPVQRGEPNSLKMRAEGFNFTSDLLFSLVLKMGRKIHPEWDRDKVIEEAEVRPMAYYHWKTVSAEHWGNLWNRHDFRNDPSIALTKFKDDIQKLLHLYRKLSQSINSNVSVG